MAVSLDDGGTRVSCSFRTPGLTSGLLASGLALMVLIAVGVGGALRTRSSRISATSSPHGKR